MKTSWVLTDTEKKLKSSEGKEGKQKRNSIGGYSLPAPGPTYIGSGFLRIIIYQVNVVPMNFDQIFRKFVF